MTLLCARKHIERLINILIHAHLVNVLLPLLTCVSPLLHFCHDIFKHLFFKGIEWAIPIINRLEMVLKIPIVDISFVWATNFIVVVIMCLHNDSWFEIIVSLKMRVNATYDSWGSGHQRLDTLFENVFVVQLIEQSTFYRLLLSSGLTFTN